MEQAFADLATWIQDAGALGYLVAPLVMAVVAIFPIPAEIPAMLNGVLFGPWVGSMVTWSGAMLGAWISFELSRAHGRRIARRVIGADALDRVDQATDEVGWQGLISLRLIPWVAFTALNWGLPLAGVSRHRFLWTTAVGIAPGAVLFTTSGVGLEYVWRRLDLAGWLAIVATIGIVVFLERLRRRRRSKAAATERAPGGADSTQ